ncbi:COX15/CtaA family protein [Timonella senegalensis]|uniref:COX15/CtaA family protein n=1 Tax=Timonella senegalensis TaxID=1465825 RepID=UPI002FDCD491
MSNSTAPPLSTQGPKEYGSSVTTTKNDAPSSADPRPQGVRALIQKLEPHANKIAIANVIAQIGIIVTGGLVRLTGSGLGCSTWPMCEPGQFTPVFHEEVTYHPFIEFGNRTLTGVLTVIAILLVLAVAFDRTRTPAMRRMAWLPLALVALQAVIGGITVLVDLHPAIVAGHMAISILLVAVSALIQYRLSPTPRTSVATHPAWLGQATWILFSLLIPVSIMGVIVTGSGPHSGDTEVGYRLEFDPMSISKIHALFVWFFVIMLIIVGVGMVLARRAGALITRAQFNGFGWVLAVTLAQGAVGYYQTYNGLPIFVVLAHMLGAGLLTLVTVRFLALMTEPVSARVS